MAGLLLPTPLHRNPLLLFTSLALICSTSAISELRIRPAGVGSAHSVYVMSEGARLELQCEIEVGEHGNPSEVVDEMEWIKGENLRIQPTGISMFTQPLGVDNKEGGGKWARLTLVIPAVNESEAGEYRCVYYETDAERRVHVQVLKSIQWHTKSDSVGGPIGQPLTVDCGADGVPVEEIKILDQKGRAIDESELAGKMYVAGAEATIPVLGAEHQGMKIRCVAVRRVPFEGGQESTDGAETAVHTDEHDISVNVWIPPTFVDLPNGGRFYAVPGSTVVLRWTVGVSNPPVVNFTLKRDGKAIVGGHPRRYAIEIQGQMAALSISEVLDEDFGSYACVAYNGKMAGEQIARLEITKPPKQPRVWPQHVTNASVSWRMEEQSESGQLPVTYFLITYRPIRRRVVKANASSISAVSPDDEFNERQWGERKHHQKATAASEWAAVDNANTNRLRRKKNPSGVYDIAGLEPHTEYEFTFVAGNQAGESDPLSMKQEITERSPEELASAPYASSAAVASWNLTALLAPLALVLFFSCATGFVIWRAPVPQQLE